MEERSIEWTRTGGKNHRVTITRMVEVPWEYWANLNALYPPDLGMTHDIRGCAWIGATQPPMPAYGAVSGLFGILGL